MKSVFLSFTVLFTFFLTSCKEDGDSNAIHQAYFGGEIINPNSRTLLLIKSGVTLDTIYLNEDNRFSRDFIDFKPGIYGFFDGKEYQNFLLEPKDSLMMRLNTFDFDESLVYTGKGAKENNFLMEMYLLNEKESNRILDLGQKSPQEFDSIYTALRETKQDKLDAFKSKHNTSVIFNEIAQASIDYEYYAHKELYPLANYKIPELDAFKMLPKDFYDYRATIDYNNATLKEYSPYLSFLRFHFNNLALQDHFSHSEDSVYNRLNLHYNLDKLRLIDEKVSNEDIKNSLLRYVVGQFINGSKSTEDFDKILESYQEKSTNTKDIERVAQFVRAYKTLKPGNQIPEVILLDQADKLVAIKTLINTPTVVYFWSKNFKNQLISSHKRAKELKVKYPEFKFIAINVDSISYKDQVSFLKNYGVKDDVEYRFKTPTTAKELLAIKPILKVIILNEKAEIVNAKANMFNLAFEHELLGVLNQ